MRPKLKADVYWARVPDGIYLAGGAGQRFIRGTSIYDWVERLGPYLDGSRTTEELVKGLEASQRGMVERVVEVLCAGGYLRDVTEDSPHSLSSPELATYADEIAFIEYHRDSAARRFQEYREQRLLLLGSGLTFACLVPAALSSGAGHLTVGVVGERPTDLGRIREFIELSAQRDVGQEVSFLERHDDNAGLTEERVRAEIKAADVVMHISDVAAIDRAVALGEMCRRHATLLVQAMVIGDSAWIGPVEVPDVDGASWLSLWLRLLANHPSLRAGAETDHSPGSGGLTSPYLAGPTASLIAHHLSFACFRHLTSVGDLSEPRTFTEIELAALRTRRRRVLRHPFTLPAGSQDEASFLDHMSQLASGEPITEASFSERTAGLFDQQIGVFASIDEREFTQIPFYVSEVVVSDPAGLLDPNDGLPRVTGWGHDFGEARRRATQAAGEVYASVMVDRRCLRPGGPGEPGEPAETSGTWGQRLSTGTAIRVGTSRVFPHLVKLGRGYRRPPGLASGATWEQAVERGLLEVCAALATTLLADRGAPFTQVSLETLQLGDDEHRCLRILRDARVKLRLYDLTSVLGVPLLAACADGETVGYRAGLTLADAVCGCLELLILHYQALTNDEVEYAPPAVPQLPSSLQGRPGLIAQNPSFSGPAAINEALAAYGYESIVVALGDDPAIREAFPYVVQVLFSDV